MSLLAGRPNLQPLGWLHLHGRAQLIPTLRQFAGHPGAWAAPHAGLPARAASPRLDTALQHRRGVWRCQAAQQLQAVGFESGAAGAAAATAAPRPLQPGEVHVWWLDPAKFGGDVDLQRCSELLTPDELQECTASGDTDVRRERVLARALVRCALAGYLPGVAHPRSLLFERNSHGKPRLLWPCAAGDGRTLRFNLTHTTTLIGLAVSAEGLVGLDVECAARRTRRDPLRLAQRRFSPAEIEELQACPDGASRAARFLQLWTLKEAYVKALGRGISAPPGLRSFSFGVGGCLQPVEQQHGEGGSSSSSSGTGGSSTGSSSSGGGGGGGGGGTIAFRTDAPDKRRWEFALLQPAPGHMAAVCVERRSSSSGRGSGQLNEAGPPQRARLLHFDAAALLAGGSGDSLQPAVLAVGAYP